MKPRFTLMTAILMTTAALVWGGNLLIAVKATGSWPLMSVMVFLAFAVLSVIYWAIYLRRKTSSHTPGNE